MHPLSVGDGAAAETFRRRAPTFVCSNAGAHTADVRARPSVAAGGGRGRDGQRAVRGQRQARAEGHVDPDAGAAGPERRHRAVHGEQGDGRAEPEPDQPQRQRAVQVRGQQRGRSDRTVGQRGRAHQARGAGRDQRVRAGGHRGTSQVHGQRQPAAVHRVQVTGMGV